MNKLGSVHSGGKKILPIGKKLCLRVMLDQYLEGNFWKRRRCDHCEASKYIYLEQRTYLQQIKEAIAEDVQEIFFVLDRRKNNFNYIQDFLHDLITVTRRYDFSGKIIYSAINEPLEHMTQSEIHWLNQILSIEAKKYENVYFAVGEMACNFFKYYKSYLDVKYHYDYISFHTDNNCSLNNYYEFIKIFPKNTKFINNEHYHYNGAKKYGYDEDRVVLPFAIYTTTMLSEDRIKSVYICMPYHAAYGGKYMFLGLNWVQDVTKLVYVSEAWKMLKQYDIEEVDLVKLPELKVGDKRFEVRALQKCLNAELECALKVDGWFGDKTRVEVVKFNKSKNVFNTDKCTYATWYELLGCLTSEVIIGDMLRILKAIE